MVFRGVNGLFLTLNAVVGSEHCQARSAPRASAHGPARAAIPPKRGVVRSLMKGARRRKRRKRQRRRETRRERRKRRK